MGKASIMSDLLYHKELLRLAANANGAGRLSHADATGEAFNPTCGDRIVVDLAYVGARIAALAHDTKACVLAQASASILGNALVDKTCADVKSLRDGVVAMLDGRAAPPSAPFADYAAFDGAVQFRSRHRCVLLPIEAVLNAFSASDAGKP